MNTPETDAFIASQNHSPTTHQLKNFARKLERERDEARNRLADTLQEVDLRTLDYERIKEQNAKLRDIAERLADELRDLANPAFDEILNEFEELKLKEDTK
jgi:hypothetical protein